jgi:hypothetical protein
VIRKPVQAPTLLRLRAALGQSASRTTQTQQLMGEGRGRTAVRGTGHRWAIVERVRTGAAPAANAVRYASRFPDEFALLDVRDLVAVSPQLADDPAVQAWIAQARGRGLFLAA